MIIGIIGVGVVGGTLKKWFEEHTIHNLSLLDPEKGYNDDLSNCEAIFICIPVNPHKHGQDTQTLGELVFKYNKITKNIFIRSTVLPGTNDFFGTISNPEFLTARRAYEDMCKLPIVLGEIDKELAEKIFPGKEKIFVSNCEAEISKYAHNCFGAFKVTFFNMIKKICDLKGAEYLNVLKAGNTTGYLGNEHLMVPGPDGKRGYGGTCFPLNMASLSGFFSAINSHTSEDFIEEALLIEIVRRLNFSYRGTNK